MGKQEEDLNLDRMRERVIRYCWLNTRRFPDVRSIAQATGLNYKTIHAIARKLNLVRATR